MTDRNILNASVRPSQAYRKHYGTEILLKARTSTGVYSASFSLWFPSGRPSDEQLEAWGYTRADWDANIEIPYGWSEGATPIQTAYLDYDNHYQSAHEVAIVERIIQALDGLELSDD